MTTRIVAPLTAAALLGVAFAATPGYNTSIPEEIMTPRTARLAYDNLDFLRGVEVFLNFGPAAPVGREKNWLQTVPGKGWFAILRLYGPTEAWFDKTWRPGEIEEVR